IPSSQYYTSCKTILEYPEAFKELSVKIYKTYNNCRLKRKNRKPYPKRNFEEKLKRIQNLPRKQCCSRCKRIQKQEEFGYTSIGKALKP
ncbi:11208_t:CDS:1, partial [Dentiscutata heterogama]